MAESTTDLFSLFDLPTSMPGSATSSPELAAGPMPSTSRAGPAAAKSGPPAFHVSRFRSRDSAKELSTNDTSGPLFTRSSPSAALQLSLENRLRRRMDGNGSPLFALTWRAMDMPSGPPACQLAASAPRIDVTVSIGWPTPTAQDAASSGAKDYPPTATHHSGTTLTDAARLASWPTPRDFDRFNEGYETAKARQDKGREAMKAGGPNWGGSMGLPAIAELTAWPTPTAANADGGQQPKTSTGKREDGSKATVSLGMIAKLTLGPISSGSPAGTENTGQLNPAFSRWLMGFPDVWDACAPTATPLPRKSQRNS
jgi:hypothetical protein